MTRLKRPDRQQGHAAALPIWVGVLIAICVIAFTRTAVRAQVPVIYFSTETSFTATAGPHAGQRISDGDLLSTTGVVVARNADLIRNFGPMPVVPDFGLDGVFVRRSGEILFSLEGGFWDEKLGTWVRHGDLLSDSGAIVKTNAQLLANFHPMPSPEPYDFGLDAVHPIGGQRVEFSIEETFWDEALGVWVRHGDLLSDSGAIVKTNAQLLSNFHPMPSPDPDYGLDAVHLVGGSDIWFSIEESFWDELLGTWISQGDLLSTQGSIVQTNAQLLAAFFGGAGNVPEDFGLDAAWLVPEPATFVLLTFGGLVWLRRRRKPTA